MELLVTRFELPKSTLHGRLAGHVQLYRTRMAAVRRNLLSQRLPLVKLARSQQDFRP
ncbi:hypothetical protein D3C72_2592410 [compost metagenome]